MTRAVLAVLLLSGCTAVGALAGATTVAVDNHGVPPDERASRVAGAVVGMTIGLVLDVALYRLLITGPDRTRPARRP